MSSLWIIYLGAFASQMMSRRVESLEDPRKGTPFKVTSILEEPYLMRRRAPGSTKGNDRYEGYIVDLLAKIAEHAHFSYTIQPAMDGHYGEERNGQWNGMIGELINKEANIAAAPMTISAPRSNVIKFSDPYMSFGMTALLTKTAANSINTFASLANQTRISYGLIRGGTTEDWFRATNDATMKQMWARMRDDGDNALMSSLAAGVDRVKHSGSSFAFIMESVTAEYWTGRRPCELTTVRSERALQNYGLATVKGSPTMDGINRAIRSLRKSGELQRMRDKWWRSECTTSSSARRPTTAGSAVSLVLLALLASCHLKPFVNYT